MNKPVSPEDLESATPVSEAAPEIAPQPAPSPAAPKSNNGLRKRLFGGLAVVVLAGAAAVGVYETAFAGHEVKTDNAYVAADTAQVTALVGGPVAQVRVIDTQAVRKGDVLVVLDDADYRLALAEAQAALSQAQRKVRGYSANDQALAGQVAARQADVARAQADVERARSEFNRRQSLTGIGAVSGEELTVAKTGFSASQAALSQAQASLRAAQGSREANAVLIEGAPLDQNPEVAAARARVERAKVALERTIVRAPVDGVVAKKSVQVGQLIQGGAPLMSVVPLQQAYVNANFKEVQLRQVEIGQPVELESDLYGKKVVYHGKVVGRSGGTGSAFAAIPAQNATGNWIKVVQRLPVRVALDPKELAAHPLEVGLSMKAVIKVH